jgi:hypothetical protein
VTLLQFETINSLHLNPFLQFEFFSFLIFASANTHFTNVSDLLSLFIKCVELGAFTVGFGDKLLRVTVRLLLTCCMSLNEFFHFPKL